MGDAIDTPGAGRDAGDGLALVLVRRNARLVRLFAVAGALTIAAVLVVSVLPMAHRDISPSLAFYGLLMGGLALAIVTYLVPWGRLNARQAAWALTALMVAGILLVGGLVATTGGASSDQILSILMITIFAAVVLPVRHQVGLYVLSAAAYVAGSAAAGPVPLGTAAYRLTIIAVVALTASYLATLLRRALADAHRSAHEAQAHATRLEAVARGIRSAQSADPAEVVNAVAQTVRDLGWDEVAIFVDDDHPRLALAAWSDEAGDEAPAIALSPLAAFAEDVFRGRDTVTVPDAAEHPTLAALRGRSTVSAIGAPFHAHGEASGVVVATTSRRHRFTPGDVDTFELVASCAGRALELARRYATEADRVNELRELDRLRSEFLSTVSHELRTPLTVILGLSETLDRTWERLPESRRRELLDRVRDNAGGLDRVIATLLDFTRLEQGRLETRFDTFDLGDLMHTVTVRLSSLLAEHHLVLDVPTSLDAYGDERLIERVLENLLTNARRHTPPGTTVRLSAVVDRDRIAVAISDDGPGIRPEEVEHLGERFFRAGDPARRHARGIGLGLALSQEVLRLHETQLRIASQPGAGTTFSFALPVPVGARVTRGTTAQPS